MKKNTREFKQGDVFWDVVSVYTQAVTSRWRINRHASVMRALQGKDLALPGVSCSCTLINPCRHEYAAQNGYFDDSCVFAEAGPSPVRPEIQFLFNDRFLLLQQQICFGHAFELAKALLHPKPRNEWPTVFEVAFHLRNGAFHGNRFRIDSRINPPAAWRTLSITKELNGKPAFGNADGVIGLGDIPILLADMRDALKLL